MLKSVRSRAPVRARQEGVVLLVALIVLVAITLAGLSMLRSVDTATLVSGNLAFQQSATQASDQGIEAAVTMIQGRAGDLGTPAPEVGYYASLDQTADNPGTANATWQQLWKSKWDEDNVKNKFVGMDDNGNKVWYVVHRECASSGAPGSGATCVASPAVVTMAEGNPDEPNAVPLNGTSQIYYRITVRVLGPRRTESYVQVHVAM